MKKAEPRYATASATGFQNSMAYGGANATGSSYGGEKALLVSVCLG